MSRHELVAGNIHQQILFNKDLDDAGEGSRDELRGRRRDGDLGHEHSRVVVLFFDVVDEGPDVLDPDVRVAVEFEVDGSDLGGPGAGLVR